MRAFAALLFLAGCSATVQNGHKYEESTPPTSFIDRTMAHVLRRLDSREEAVIWPEKVISCARTLGAGKCIKSFSVWRAEKAVDLFTEDRDVRFNVMRELDQFPWERFANTSESEVDERLSDGALKLLRFRSLSMPIFNGLQLELDSKENGTVSMDVCSRSEGESRGMGKKIRNRFYRIVPFLLLPGLFMSAVLPFMLPALKLMTVAVGMLNNMAFTGAIFTLLRNNAFNDNKYTKKVVYVNDGYKNEKHKHLYYEDDLHDVYYNEGDKYYGAGSNIVPVAPSQWLYEDAIDANMAGYKTRSDKLPSQVGNNGEYERKNVKQYYKHV